MNVNQRTMRGHTEDIETADRQNFRKQFPRITKWQLKSAK